MTETDKNDDQDAGPPGNGITEPLSDRKGEEEQAGSGESDDDHHDDPVTGIGPEDPS